ncbi:MAG TPA: FAD-dependent oxidoreductase [Solirubrobacteraceae bacterium]|nr:FAD-dependent oxidoreductase [Solirubrobacteraceae bacterium]
MSDERVVIIGAGVLGALTAYRLLRRGARVTLVDAQAPGSGTTATGYAHVNASYAGYWDYFGLRAAGIAGYRQLRAELGQAPWLHDVGCLQFESDPGGWDALLHHAQRLRDAGYPVARLTRDGLLEIEPDLRVPEAVDEILFYTDEGYVDGAALVADLVDRSVAHGLELHTDDAVTGVEARGGRVRSVTLASGRRIDTELAVCCCGRWSDALLRQAGVELSVMTVDEPGAATPGLIVTTKPVTHRLRRMVIADGVNIRTGADGRLIVWSGDVDAQLQQDRSRAAAQSAHARSLAQAALDAARPYVASLAGAQIESATICIRALPRDGLPTIGWLPNVSGLYLIAAHAATTLAPAAAEMATSELLDGADVAALQAFRPARFAQARDRGATAAPPAGAPGANTREEQP